MCPCEKTDMTMSEEHQTTSVDSQVTKNSSHPVDTVKDRADVSSPSTIPQSQCSSRSLGSLPSDDESTRQRRMTPYERLSRDLTSDHHMIQEITLGKRVGFYRVRGDLGSGNFSTVKLAIHSLTKEKVALKIIDKTKMDQKTRRLLSREIGNMERLHHEHIIRLYEVVETLSKLHLVMEYAHGGELFAKVTSEGRLSENEAKPLFGQVVSAVQHMHSACIIHRDIKAENLFFTNSRTVKLGDFGFSTNAEIDQKLNTFCGSPPYAAPELFKDENYTGVMVDVWALGILLFFMVTSTMPFRAETVGKLKKCILDGVYQIPNYISESCQTLITDLLKQIPTERLSLTQITQSGWLEGVELPSASQSYKLLPSEDKTDMDSEENEVRVQLEKLGITDEHIKQCQNRDSHSNITGTYRIVLHTIQRRKTEGDREGAGDYADDDINKRDIMHNNTKQSNKKTNGKKQKKTSMKSKLCTIL